MHLHKDALLSKQFHYTHLEYLLVYFEKAYK